jgi:hypothetical protein
LVNLYSSTTKLGISSDGRCLTIICVEVVASGVKSIFQSAFY